MSTLSPQHSRYIIHTYIAYFQPVSVSKTPELDYNLGQNASVNIESNLFSDVRSHGLNMTSSPDVASLRYMLQDRNGDKMLWVQPNGVACIVVRLACSLDTKFLIF